MQFIAFMWRSFTALTLLLYSFFTAETEFTKSYFMSINFNADKPRLKINPIFSYAAKPRGYSITKSKLSRARVTTCITPAIWNILRHNIQHSLLNTRTLGKSGRVYIKIINTKINDNLSAAIMYRERHLFRVVRRRDSVGQRRPRHPRGEKIKTHRPVLRVRASDKKKNLPTG